MGGKDFYKQADNSNLRFSSQTDTLLTEDEKWLVALSGIFSSLAGDYVDTIDTGRSNKDIREALRAGWLVNDRATFEGLALRLAIGEKRELYLARFQMLKRFFDFYEHSNIVIKSVSKLSPLLALDWYQTRTKEDIKALAKKELELDRFSKSGSKKNEELFVLLKDSSHWLKKLEVIGDYRCINSLVGWDAVCLVNLARCATQIGFIERQEFVKYAGAVKKQVQASYNNWSEVALAYLIGSFLWKYSEEKAQATLKSTKHYLENEKTFAHVVSFK